MVAVSTGTDSGLWRRMDWSFFHREKQTRDVPTSLMVVYGGLQDDRDDGFRQNEI
jgi:hypothetical protein